MKQTGEKGRAFVGRKAVIVLVSLIILLVLSGSVLVYAGVCHGKRQEDGQEAVKMSELLELANDVSRQRTAAGQWFSDFVEKNVRLTTSWLRNYVKAEGYTGPRVFADGFVAEFSGDKVILPEGIPEGDYAISRALIEESLESGSMLTGRFTSTADNLEVLDRIWSGGTDAYTDETRATCYLSFGEIGENYIYVDMTRETEYLEMLALYTAEDEAALVAVDHAFEGVTLVFLERDGHTELLRKYGETKGTEEAALLSRLDADATLLQQKEFALKADGREYRCAVRKMETGKLNGEKLTIVQLLPRSFRRRQNVVWSLLIVQLMMIILVLVLIYMVSVLHYAKKQVFSEEEAARYSPGNVQKRMVSAGVIAMVTVFTIAVFIQSIGQIYRETRYGKETLEIIENRLKKANETVNEAAGRQEESWNVYFGQKLAGFLSENPELQTAEKLRSCCELLGMDSIMLFDGNGKETLSSGDFVGFTLEGETGEHAADFSRLLLGAPSVIRSPFEGGLSGLYRKYYGVRMSIPGETERYGALLMTAVPDENDEERQLQFPQISSHLVHVTGDRSLCLVARDSDGVILCASDDSMEGKNVTEYGLPTASLRDGYMDFESVRGERRFFVTRREENFVYYYTVEAGIMFNWLLQYGFLSAVLFALSLALILLVLFRGYTEERFWERITVSRAVYAKKEPKIFARRAGVRPDGQEKESSGLLQKMRRKITENLDWESRTPEKKASLVFHTGLLLMILTCWGALMRESVMNSDSFMDFLLHREWNRGFNVFSIYSVLLVVASAYLINTVFNWVILLTGSFLSSRGETICQLLRSAVKYLALLGAMYFALGYMGVPTETIVASLGIVSLALSLGARDLIADILAGVAILIEKSFEVGDIVEINGKRGTVLEIGVRMTRLKMKFNHILILNNHDIRDIVNLTEENSEQRVSLRLRNRGSLLQAEKLLEKELPPIGSRHKEFITGPYYVGVTEINGGMMAGGVTLTIGAVCMQENAEAVARILNRELLLLFEREGIELG